VGAGSASAKDPRCSVPAAPQTLTLRDLPAGSSVVACDAVGRDVRNGQITLTIPLPGSGVWQDIDYPDRAESFAVTVDLNGIIGYPESEHPDSAVQTLAASNECTQNGYDSQDAEMADAYDWWLGDGTRPAGLTTSETQSSITDFLNNITQVNNNCGRDDNVSATLDYQDVTSYESDFHIENGESKCGDGSLDNRDGRSVIDFGNLDDNGEPPLATTCKWTFPTPGATNNILEADVRFNTSNFDWTNTGGSASCSGRYDLRHVGTHEGGHVFGLGHVSAATDPDLTMRQGSSPCTIWKRTLGLGDMIGLESKY
jgi:hypothetical protein